MSPLAGTLGPRIVDELSRPIAENERPEERLLRLGLLGGRDLALEISMKSGRAFAGLRELEADLKLFLYVPMALCEREHVVPLVLIGDTLTVASAFLDPDLALARRRFPKLHFDEVIAPYDEVRTALSSARARLEGAA